MLISVAFVFVLSAWLGLENAVETRGGSLEGIGSMFFTGIGVVCRRRRGTLIKWLKQQVTIFFFEQRSLHLYFPCSY